MKLPKHANSIIYLISLLIPVVLTVIILLINFIALTLNTGKSQYPDGQYLMASLIINGLFSFILLMLIPLLTYIILYFIQLYRMWNVINDGQTRATPGKAIGYLFIPFFNLYWIFNIWGGFPTDYNAYVHRYRLNGKVPLLEPTVFQVFPVLILLSSLIITTPILLIVFAVLLNRSNLAIDNLRAARAEIHQPLPPQPIQSPIFQSQTNYS